MYKEFLIVFDNDFLTEIELLCHSLSIDYQIIIKFNNYHFFINLTDYETFYKNLNEFINENLFFLEEEKKEKIEIPILNEKASLFSVLIILGICLFYFYYTIFNKKYFFVSIGANDAYKVLNGEFYRCVTALTLHANIIHLASNIIFFSIIFRYVVKFFGEGLSWFLIIISGIWGNFFTSFIYGSFHSSIGFSTSVFATIGILANINLKILKNYLPLIGAFFLLIMLGGGDKKVDVLSHITGLISGFAITEIILKKYSSIISHKNQIYFKIITISILILSWLFALLSN